MVNFHGGYFSIFTPEDQNNLTWCFMENGRNGDETAKYVLLMVLADPEMSPSKFLLVLHIFKYGLVFFSLSNAVQMRGKILFSQPQWLYSFKPISFAYKLPCGDFLTLNQSIWYKKGQWVLVLKTFLSCYGAPNSGKFQLTSREILAN